MFFFSSGSSPRFRRWMEVEYEEKKKQRIAATKREEKMQSTIRNQANRWVWKWLNRLWSLYWMQLDKLAEQLIMANKNKINLKMWVINSCKTIIMSVDFALEIYLYKLSAYTSFENIIHSIQLKSCSIYILRQPVLISLVKIAVVWKIPWK